MKSLKVSFIPCGVHVKVSDSFERPFIDYDVMNHAVESLREIGLDVYEHKEFIQRRNNAVKAIKDSEKQNVDCIIFYAATWLWASEIVAAAAMSSNPLIIWTTPIAQGWATGGAMVLHGTFDEIGLKHKFVYGYPDDPETMKKIKSYVNAARTVKRLKGSTVGLIGGFSMGTFPGRVDEAVWLEKFGINIDHIDQYAVIKAAKQFTEKDVAKQHGELRHLIENVPSLDEVMNRSIRLYLSMKKILRKNGFNATALKCFPEIGDYYATACLAQSLLGYEGFTTACIGDLITALTAYILYLLSESSVFNPDVQRVKKKDGVIVLTSDGACPLDLAKNVKEVKLSKRGLFGEGEANGICVGLVCKPSPITLARLNRIKGKYYLHIASGEAYIPPKESLDDELNACGFPNWPHAFVKLSGDPEAFIQNQRSEYISMCYGDLKEELLDLCYLLGIEPLVTK